MRTRPRWIWWHLLNLDAPTVAALWAHLFSHVGRVRLSWHDYVVLTGAVWLVYTADHVLDGSLATDPHHLKLRHRFAHRQRHVLAVVWAAVLLVVSGITLFGTERILIGAGLGVLGSVIAYLCAVHLRRGSLMPDWIKRSFVAVIFSIGTALPAGVQAAHPERMAASATAFAALCFLNCTAIDTWERHEPRTGHLFGAAAAACAGIFALLCALPFFPAGRVAFAACAISALSLSLVDATRDRFTAEALRVLADAALLTAAVSLGHV